MVKLRDHYPFQGKTLNIRGMNLHYLDEGQGAPVLMVHGNPTWSFYYRNLVTALRDHYRVIVPDHMGCGLSDKPPESQYDYTLENRIADLTSLVESLDLTDKITLVVHDWGGMIGTAFATRYPDKIEKMVIFNTAGFHLPENKRFPWILGLVRTPLGSLLVRGFNGFCVGSAWTSCTRNRLSRDLRKLYCLPYDSWKNRLAVLRFVQDIPLKPGDPGYDIVSETQDNLDKLKDVPKIIFWGGRDFIFDNAFLAEWKRRCPEAVVHEFSDAGHYVLEDAFEDILPPLKNFLDPDGESP